MSFGSKAAFLALGAAGVAVVTSYISKSSSHNQYIASKMREQIDDYNSHVHPEQDPHATLFDRTQLLNDAKARKPWNRTYAEAGSARHDERLPWVSLGK